VFAPLTFALGFNVSIFSAAPIGGERVDATRRGAMSRPPRR